MKRETQEKINVIAEGLANRLSVTEIARQLSLSRQAVYKLIKQYQVTIDTTITVDCADVAEVDTVNTDERVACPHCSGVPQVDRSLPHKLCKPTEVDTVDIPDVIWLSPKEVAIAVANYKGFTVYKCLLDKFYIYSGSGRPRPVIADYFYRRITMQDAKEYIDMVIINEAS